MKRVLAVALLVYALGEPFAQGVACEDLAKKTEATFKKMNDALNLKAGMLLGEMQTAKSALEGCVEWNKAQSAQMALIWVFGDAGLLAAGALLFFHQRRMKRAVHILSNILKGWEPNYAVRHTAAPGLYRWTLGVLVFLFVGLNVVALFL
jgi:hypothetical protein